MDESELESSFESSWVGLGFSLSSSMISFASAHIDTREHKGRRGGGGGYLSSGEGLLQMESAQRKRTDCCALRVRVRVESKGEGEEQG